MNRKPLYWKIPLIAIGIAVASSCKSTERIDCASSADEVMASYTAPGDKAIPGLAVSVIKGGSPVYRGAWGVRKRGSPERVAIDDAFHIGSDTKAMTSILCGIAVDRGLLSWTSTIDSVLGKDFPMRDEYRGVSLETLLSQRSGLPAGLPQDPWLSFFSSKEPVRTERARMAAEALALNPAHAPDSAFLYSNLNYVVAGLMLERTTGRDWESLMEKELFKTLGMSGAGFGPPAKGSGGKAVPTAVWGHAPDPVDPDSPYADNPPAIGPAGTARASLADLEKYLGLYVSGGKGPDGVRIISEASLAEIMRPRGDGYALGWGAGADDSGRSYIAHDGSNSMFYCSIIVFPGKGEGIIVLANRGDGDSGRRVGEIVKYLGSRFLAAKDSDAAP